MATYPVLPSVSGGHTTIGVVERNLSALTDMNVFENLSEQRWKNRSTRTHFQLQYEAITLGDKLALEVFLTDSAIGSAFPFRFVMAGSTYGICQLDQEAVVWTESAQFPGQYNTTLSFHETQLAGYPTQYVLGPFPFVLYPNTQVISGYPYVTTENFYVERVDLPAGPRRSYIFIGAPGMPARPLLEFTLSFPALTNGQLTIFDTHFRAAGGAYRSFQFLEPNSFSYYTVRYASDQLKVTHLGYNLNSLQITLHDVQPSGQYVKTPINIPTSPPPGGGGGTGSGGGVTTGGGGTVYPSQYTSEYGSFSKQISYSGVALETITWNAYLSSGQIAVYANTVGGNVIGGGTSGTRTMPVSQWGSLGSSAVMYDTYTGRTLATISF